MSDNAERTPVEEIVAAMLRDALPVEKEYRVKVSVEPCRKCGEERPRPSFGGEPDEVGPDLHAAKRMLRLCGPIPPQQLTDLLAGVFCETCLNTCTKDREMRCRRAFAAQSLAVTAFIREQVRGEA